ncbi:hypothetical protein FRB94_014034 [Tulasnella sp. JGI-2019a]|nr:hypothetical protein FRB93_013983 [Tulasnella sp. JGI-2019a]KAG9007706.1 hypothetical protein FRB94_014034 [Tulasnella sp. JGI-2019a]KAG9034948.1 hypothetical protein FRB95_012364 [Tulasnella sp. JGI-2019a]
MCPRYGLAAVSRSGLNLLDASNSPLICSLLVDEDEVIVEPPGCENPMSMELIDSIYEQRVKREKVKDHKAGSEDQG